MKQSTTRRKYLVDGKPVPGVTTVIGDTLARNKGALIGYLYRPHKER